MVKVDDKLQKVLESFPLFAKNFIHITDNDNKVVKFSLNDAQLDIDNLMSKNRFVIVGKARQAGISTYTLGKALHRAVTRPNENIIIVSYKSDSAKALFEKLKMMNDYLPREKFPNVFPSVVRDNRDELVLSNGSKIKSAVASNKDLGRGSSYSYVHLSEFAFFANQETQLLSIEQSLQKGANSQLTIETTSNGVGNFFYRLFMQSEKKESKYVNYFIPFYHRLYKTQFANDYSEAEEWYKATNKGKRLTTEDLEDDEVSLHKMGANFKQLMWRRWKLMDMESPQQFQQEYPSNPLESFISTGQSVFDQTKVLSRLSFANPILDRKIVLSECPESNRKYVGRGLDLFKLPERSKRYYVGVDTASGSGRDYSTIAIFDGDGEQVASFYNNKIPIYEFAQVIYDLGMYYNYAFLCVEKNSYGNPLIERLRKEKGYLNMYKMKTFDQMGKKKLQVGFITTQKSKAVMITDFKEQFELGLINIHCRTTLQQMQMFIETNGSTGNKKGNSDLHHDDSVIAVGLAIQGMKANKWYV